MYYLIILNILQQQNEIFFLNTKYNTLWQSALNPGKEPVYYLTIKPLELQRLLNFFGGRRIFKIPNKTCHFCVKKNPQNTRFYCIFTDFPFVTPGLDHEYFQLNFFILYGIQSNSIFKFGFCSAASRKALISRAV